MTGAPAIPDDRPLTEHEEALVRWMLEHGNPAAAGIMPQLSAVRVASGCPCGCASVDFSVRGVLPPPGPLRILADFEYTTVEGNLCGAFVFERAGQLAGLEVWSVDGLCTPSTIPAIGQLRPLGGVVSG
jgi:hypothetical protein